MLNISNHPSSKWSLGQLAAAEACDIFHGVTDIPFPNVPPDADPGDITAMAQELLVKVIKEHGFHGVALVQGEFSLTYELTRMLLALGWTVVVATSERKTVDLGGGTKTTVFEFVQFRALRG